MTEIDYAARVARGIALMDEKWPDWATEIDLEKLDIESSTACMTAQYAQRMTKDACRDFYDGMCLLELSEGDEGSYVAHGFNAPVDSLGYAGEKAAYATLNGLWKAEIERRRAQAQDAPAEPETSA